jgi:HD-GYP domain-containing protein (c-di-GMP phosphodiesterase class II)
VNNKPTVFFIILVIAVIGVLMYLTIKIWEQTITGIPPINRAFRYFIPAAGFLLVLLAFLWVFYLFVSYKGKYLSLKRINTKLQTVLTNTKNEANRIYFAALNTLTAALQARDDSSQHHLDRVARYAVALGNKLEMPQDELADLYCAALLHDLGKIGIPEEILNKPGSLTCEEFALVRKHPEIGTKILETMAVSEKISAIILHHHEFYNGTGYPSGLARDEIPLGARIIAIADAYDVMISNRPYSRAKTHEEAVTELIRCAGVQFDPHIIMHFLEVIEQKQDGSYNLPDENFFYISSNCLVN